MDNKEKYKFNFLANLSINEILYEIIDFEF